MTEPTEKSGSDYTGADAISSARLSSQYLWMSILVAILPLLIFSALYDAYTSQLINRITEEQLATRMTAVQNEFRVYLRERQHELQSLTDQLDTPEIFTPEGQHLISSELEDLLRLQLDYRTLHGIAFFDDQKQLIWTFPDQALRHIEQLDESTPTTSVFDQTELIGPTPHSWARPSVLILQMPVNSHTLKDAKPGYIGLILRFNTLTAFMDGVIQGGIYQPLLKVADGRYFDIVGQPVQPSDAHFHHPIIQNWSLHLVQNQALVASPSENMRQWLILMVVGTAAGLLVLHFYLSNRLNKQVDTLVSHVEQVASGDLDTPLPPSMATQETARLNQAIDRMRGQLKQMIHSSLEMEKLASLGQVAAGLAHDIRNPLTTIRTSIQALARRESREDHREILHMVEEEIDRVDDVIENLLNYTRPHPPHAESIPVKMLFDSLLALVEAAARRQNITVTNHCQTDLILWADYGQVRQILLNLILNAIQAMISTGNQIQLCAQQDGQFVKISVKDNGPGIPAEHLNRITEPFFTTKPAGTGLGLAICQVLATQNQGQFSIDSNVEHGTDAHLYLPLPSELIDE